MTAKKPSMPTPWTDPDDAPALSEAFFQTADRCDGTTPKPRGRPKAAMTKEAVNHVLLQPLVGPGMVHMHCIQQGDQDVHVQQGAHVRSKRRRHRASDQSDRC